jgi:hypothetical protein
MPTTQEEKSAKARSRSRKADQRRSKSGQPQVEQPQVEMTAEPDPVSPMVAETDPMVAEAEVAAAVEAAPTVATEQAFEQASEPALSGEVLPREVIAPQSGVDGLQAIAQAYGDYTRKSWLNSRFLIERLMTVRSFDEAVQIQGEFTKQAYTNFLVQSERICVLYGEWTQQFFRPIEKLAAKWPHIGR